MKLTNTWKHALIGLALGLTTRLGMWIFGVTEQMTIFMILVFALFSAVWEINQINHSINPHYLKDKGWDSLADFVAGNACFVLPMLLWNPIL